MCNDIVKWVENIFPRNISAMEVISLLSAKCSWSTPDWIWMVAVHNYVNTKKSQFNNIFKSHDEESEYSRTLKWCFIIGRHIIKWPSNKRRWFTPFPSNLFLNQLIKKRFQCIFFMLRRFFPRLRGELRNSVVIVSICIHLLFHRWETISGGIFASNKFDFRTLVDIIYTCWTDK